MNRRASTSRSFVAISGRSLGISGGRSPRSTMQLRSWMRFRLAARRLPEQGRIVSSGASSALADDDVATDALAAVRHDAGPADAGGQVDQHVAEFVFGPGRLAAGIEFRLGTSGVDGRRGDGLGAGAQDAQGFVAIDGDGFDGDCPVRQRRRPRVASVQQRKGSLSIRDGAVTTKPFFAGFPKPGQKSDIAPGKKAMPLPLGEVCSEAAMPERRRRRESRRPFREEKAR